MSGGELGKHCRARLRGNAIDDAKSIPFGELREAGFVPLTTQLMVLRQ